MSEQIDKKMNPLLEQVDAILKSTELLRKNLIEAQAEIAELKTFLAFPFYILTDSLNHWDGKRNLIRVNSDVGNDVDILMEDGTFSFDGSCYTNCLILVAEGLWEKISNDEAQKIINELINANSFPKYFLTDITETYGPRLVRFTSSSNSDCQRLTNSGIWEYDGSSLKSCLNLVRERYWKQLTVDEAEKIIASVSTFPLYILTDCEEAYGSKEKRILRINAPDRPADLLKGNEFVPDGSNYKTCLPFIQQGCWKVISKEEVDKIIEERTDKPRYFVAATNVNWYETFLVRATKKDCIVFYEAKDPFVDKISNIIVCLQNVKNGAWKEISEVEASTLFAQKATYLIYSRFYHVYF